MLDAPNQRRPQATLPFASSPYPNKHTGGEMKIEMSVRELRGNQKTLIFLVQHLLLEYPGGGAFTGRSKIYIHGVALLHALCLDIKWCFHSTKRSNVCWDTLSVLWQSPHFTCSAGVNIVLSCGLQKGMM